MSQPQEEVPSKDPVLETIQQAKLDVPSSSVGVFDLPCGLLEEDMLGSKAVPSHKKIGMLIAGCLERVGSISDKGRLSQVAEELTVGDRVFLMFAIRRTSLGNEYPFRGQCPKCKYRGIFNLDLSDLDVKMMAEPMLRTFERKLPSGKVAQFRPLVGKDEESISKAASSNEAMSLSILMRLQQLEAQPPTLAAVKDLGMKDRNFLRAEFEKIEGGVDTTLEMSCPSCNHEFEEELDVAQAGFFFPSSVRKD